MNYIIQLYHKRFLVFAADGLIAFLTTFEIFFGALFGAGFFYLLSETFFYAAFTWVDFFFIKIDFFGATLQLCFFSRIGDMDLVLTSGSSSKIHFFS